MNVKLVLVLAVAGLLVLAARTASSTRRSQDHVSAPGAEKRGTIAWHVKQAKTKGKKKVSLLPIEENPAVVTGLEDAFSQYTVLIAQLVEKKSLAQEASIVTWNRLRVLEFLSQPTTPSCAKCLSGLNAPPDLVPLINEVLVPTQGGAVTVDGVEVDAEGKGLDGHFKPGQKYLLFLSLDPAERIGKLALIQYGVFTLDANNRIQSIAAGDDPLKRDLGARVGNSLSTLKEHTKKKR